jgi:hypothetical protein
MIDMALAGLGKSLKDQMDVSQIGFILYEILTIAGYDHEEIPLIANVMQETAAESDAMDWLRY